MNESGPNFASELRVPLKPVSVGLVALGLVTVLTSDIWSHTHYRYQVLLFSTLFQGIAVTTWLLGKWKDWAGRWFTIVALVGMVHLGNSWFDMPGFLYLVVVPTVLAAILIGLRAAAYTAVGETVLLALALRYDATRADWASVIVPLVVNWAALGLTYVVYRPMYRLAEWCWDYYQQGLELLAEVGDRHQEINQTLEDLANANVQLTKLNIVAQQLRQAAEDARTAKEQFVANVSHELRTPLNMVVGFSETILQAPEIYNGEIPPALMADLAVIHRNASHLSDLIDDVLDLSQIEAGQMALTKEYVRFHEIIEAATIAVRPLFDSKGLYLETEVSEDLIVFCDHVRIREVLLNLLSNAGRFTERGGVWVRAWREEDDVFVSVADTGPGIAAQDLERIFQPFQQVDGSIRRRYGGTGLGLSISKSFIELHGGEISVESEETVGTTFSLRLPMLPAVPVDGDFQQGLVPGWEYLQRVRPSRAPKPVVRPRFVVLEEGNALQRLLARYLDVTEIVPATTLGDACAELSRVPSQALLINGASVSRDLEDLMSSTVLPIGTPAIICSVPSARNARNASGVFDYFVKPISRDALLGALDRLGLRGGTILIVDDEPDALHLFRRMLASSGHQYRVLLATDGRQALDSLQEHRPDLMLLDLVMPNMSGFQLLERKNQEPALRDVPIIVTSARDPLGQPIVSSALAVTQAGGLSAQQLLASIRAMSGILSASGQVDDPMPTKVPSAQPVYG